MSYVFSFFLFFFFFCTELLVYDNMSCARAYLRHPKRNFEPFDRFIKCESQWNDFPNVCQALVYDLTTVSVETGCQRQLNKQHLSSESMYSLLSFTVNTICQTFGVTTSTVLEKCTHSANQFVKFSYYCTPKLWWAMPLA
jgi:hypothetical protein